MFEIDGEVRCDGARNGFKEVNLDQRKNANRRKNEDSPKMK